LPLEIALHDSGPKGHVASLLGTVCLSDDRIDERRTGGQTRGTPYGSAACRDHNGNRHGE
jgi:hypothetical protein